MEHHAAIDVSLEWSSVCVVDAAGQIVREAKVRSEREALVGFFEQSGLRFVRGTPEATVILGGGYTPYGRARDNGRDSSDCGQGCCGACRSAICPCM